MPFAVSRSIAFLWIQRAVNDGALRREAAEAPGEDDARMTDEELADLLAEAWDNKIEEVDEKVQRMERCVRKHGLTSRQRKATSSASVRYAVDTEAHVSEDGTYHSVYNPFLVDSTSLRYDRSIHENAHHVYHAENDGAASKDHPRGWTDIHDAIRSKAWRFCRGGG
ncbi:MAG: hypothetical protein OXH09_05175 [Gammaproteobacteria bacterium]|nr:hypothetical protein [Gammaproteobacteria bacterium]